MVHGYQNYDKNPYVTVKNCDNQCFAGVETIQKELAGRLIGKKKAVLCIDCYQGVNQKEVLELIAPLHPTAILEAESFMKPEEEIFSMLERNITDVIFCERKEWIGIEERSSA